jgi:TRAP-type C4-dicarboxylate transport system permease small subunit
MKSFLKAISGLPIKLLAFVAASVLALMMFLVMSDVILRYIFNRPIIGSFEIVQYFMAILTSFAVVYCAYEKGHVYVEIVFDRLPKKAQLILACFVSFILLILLLLFAWQNIMYTREIYNQRITSAILYIPTYPFVGAVAISFVGSCIIVLIDFLQNLFKMVKR